MPRNIYKLILLAVVLMTVISLYVPAEVRADANNLLFGEQAGNLQGAIGLGSDDPRIMIANIIRIILGFLGIIALLLMLYGGWLWMSSAGDANKIDQAKKVITGAIIGLVIILMSFAIASFIINRLYQATSGSGGSCTVGVCSGCQRCQPGTPPFLAADNSCPGCTGLIPTGPVSCDSNTMNNIPLFTCDASNTICDTTYSAEPPGTYFCDSSSCTCRRLGGFGDPCDSIPATTACDYDDGMCQPFLKCDQTQCLCLGAPVIDWVSPVNTTGVPFGTPGNLVTIGGRYFGSTTGAVFFSASPSIQFSEQADPPSTVNSACIDYWSETQIVVAVPSGAGDGPIRVQRADSAQDETNNTRGAPIPDFLENGQRLPGICALTPGTGAMSDTVTYSGISLLNGSANFGAYTGFVEAQSSSFPTNLSGTGVVPNIANGRTTTFASTSDGFSNAMTFIISPSAPAGPFITRFDDVSGPERSYVTIFGSGFGAARGTSRVFFGTPTGGTEADYNFPPICADSIWSDNQVVVKVPNVPANGPYPIYMTIGSYTISTASLTPDTYNVTNAALEPGLCKISPLLGPANSPVSLWGEYFDAFDADSKVRFHLNHDQTGAAIASWAISGDVYKVDTTVHQSAVTGPVNIVKGAAGLVSNPMNFTVGRCTVNADCGGTNVCCQPGTFAAGRCVATEDQCLNNIPSSVFEWDFNTAIATITPGMSCDGNTTTSGCQANPALCTIPGQTCNPVTCICEGGGLSACAGYNMAQCALTQLCPNSPGECSPYLGGGTQITGSCNYGCSATTTINTTYDRCMVNGSICDNNATTTDVSGRVVTTACVSYSGSGRWQYDSIQSCKAGWQRIPGNKCVDLSRTCNLCATDEVCIAGQCALNTEQCPGSPTCNPSNQCIAADDPECSCCCRIASGNADCCAPLTCEGNCGSDKTVDTNSFGYCSGCANAGVTQADHDNACNCTGTSGKYCETSDPSFPSGVCRDCAELSNVFECSLHASPTTCCVDAATPANNCRGNIPGNPLVAGNQCAYFECQVAFPSLCESSIPLSAGTYPSIPICNQGCSANTGPSGLGLSCSLNASTTCNTAMCSSPFACLTSSGGAGSYPTDCGICCCHVGSNDCATINSGLYCKEDLAPCSGPGRGLCCGCEKNQDCVPAGGTPFSVGCGVDSCCHARPSVTSIFPADNATGICRNAMMTATFDQKMDLSSLSSSNIIVAGDWGMDPCPANTTYLALGGGESPRHNIFVRLYDKFFTGVKKIIRAIFPVKLAEAYTFPVSNHNYCAIKGSASGYHLTSGQSVMEFKPTGVLDGSRLYYVIIKGDETLASSTGVRSLYGIGMNGPVVGNNTFNGITYNRSFIWSFTTLPAQTASDGICKLDRVNLVPGSYLFQTTTNDSNENDNVPTNATFDTVADSDKVFVATPLSQNGQLINTLPGIYDWTWNWSSSNINVASIITSIPIPEPTRELVRTAPDITEGRTLISAATNIITDTIFGTPTPYAGPAGKADVYVFICQNPWPPLTITGTWAPWRDLANNCDVFAPGCMNTNYELYYCRDAGKYGTYDDLPAVLNDAVVRGMPPAPATTTYIKEAYYFREPKPSGSSGLTASLVAAGSAIDLSWPAVGGVAGYKVYWGRSSNNYTGSEDVGMTLSYTVNNLTNNQKYYFNLTSYLATGAESEPYGEISATPLDTVPPGTPGPLTATSTVSGQIDIKWPAVADATGYELAYGTVSNVYGKKVRIGNVLNATVRSLTSGKLYYFAVIALDASGNRATSTPISYTAR